MIGLVDDVDASCGLCSASFVMIRVDVFSELNQVAAQNFFLDRQIRKHGDAEPCGDRALDGTHHVHRDHVRDGNPLTLQPAQRGVAHSVFLIHHPSGQTEVFFGRIHGNERARRTRDKNKVVAKAGKEFKRSVKRRAADEADVKAVFQDAGLNDVIVLNKKRRVDSRELLLERGKPARENVYAAGSVGADNERTGQASLLRREDFFNFLGFFDDERGVRQKAQGRGAWDEPGGRTGKKFGVERFFKLFKRLTGGAGRHAQLGGGFGEILLAADAQKNLQLS